MHNVRLNDNTRCFAGWCWYAFVQGFVNCVALYGSNSLEIFKSTLSLSLVPEYFKMPVYKKLKYLLQTMNQRQFRQKLKIWWMKFPNYRYLKYQNWPLYWRKNWIYQIRLWWPMDWLLPLLQLSLLRYRFINFSFTKFIVVILILKLYNQPNLLF